MARRRRKKGSALPMGWGLAFVFVVALGGSLYASPLTSVRVVRVYGSQSWHRDAIRETLAELEGRAAALSSQAKIERDIEATSAVERARFSRNIFGRGRLALEYRVPVARLADAPDTLLDASSVLFQNPEAAGPKLAIKVERIGSNLAFSSPFRLGDLVLLATKMQVRSPNVQGTLAIESSGGLFLTASSGLKVRFGTPDDLDAKLARLNRLIAAGIGDATEIVLVVPSEATKR